jgi:flagellar motility protein MotE (MotC chaperone)
MWSVIVVTLNEANKTILLLQEVVAGWTGGLLLEGQDDQILAAEQALLDTKTRIRDAKRRARLAETFEEQRGLQEDLKTLERQRRRQRQTIFDVEDEIEARRDQLIEALEERMKKKTLVHPLFRIHWQIV